MIEQQLERVDPTEISVSDAHSSVLGLLATLGTFGALGRLGTGRLFTLALLNWSDRGHFGFIRAIEVIAVLEFHHLVNFLLSDLFTSEADIRLLLDDLGGLWCAFWHARDLLPYDSFRVGCPARIF